VLKTHGLNDVRCEIRETDVKAAAAHPTVIPTLGMSEVSVAGTHYPGFTEAIGQSIALETDPAREASLTCYMALGKERNGPSDIYGLISRHLPFQNDCNVYKSTTSGPAHHIIMPGDATLEDARKNVENALKTWENQMTYVRDNAAELEFVKGQLQIAESFRRHLISLKKPESRRIGRVVYSPARLPEARTQAFGGSAHSKKAEWLPDYALVLLDPARFKSRLCDLNNTMYLEDNQGLVSLNHQICAKPFKFPDNNGPLRLRGVIPAAELCLPTSRNGRLASVDGEFILRVGKRGRTTGLTWGQGNEIESVTRKMVNGRDVKALHWPVISVGLGPFSDDGDSGAAVFTADGQLVAMMDGGCKHLLPRFDITYTTPLEWVQEHIKKHAFPSASFV